MHETPFVRQPSSRSSIASLIGLELLPLAAPVAGIGLVVGGIQLLGGTLIEFLLVPVFLIGVICILSFFVSGLGWLTAERERVGLTLLVVRGVTALAVAGWSLHKFGQDWGGEADTSSMVYIMYPAFWLVLLAPVVSAIALALVTLADRPQRDAGA